MVGRLLASSSVAALLIGAGTPAAFAACANNVHATFDNPAAHTTACVAVTNTSFTGNLTNEGTISPGGIAFTNGTITGFIASSGIIAGGINFDGASTVTAAPAAISITGPTFLGGISNAGVLSSTAAIGIFVDGTTTFGGGISNSGTIAGVVSAIQLNSVSTFSGGITNSGTLRSGSKSAIFIQDVGIFTGTISNSGTITGAFGIGVSHSTIAGQIVDSGLLAGGIHIDSTSKITSAATAIAITGSSFAGGISSGGTITAANAGILLQNVTSFGGGITNTGTLAGATGIALVASTIHGAIADSGVLTGGIKIDHASAITSAGGAITVTGPTFLGGISNAGTISASAAVAIGVSGTTTFGGGIVNTGTVSGGVEAIDVSASTFSGGITNSGLLTSGTKDVIFIDHVGTFAGTISNSGTVSGPSGLSISASTIVGQIIDSGAFFGGIKIDATSKIASAATAIAITGPSFSGSISNGGTVTAANAGVLLQNVASFGGGITNTGTLAGTTGINLVASTMHGQIADSGVLSGGIKIDHASTVTFAGTAISLTGPTFLGGISNAGTISAANGAIDINGVSTFGGGIRNSGTVTAGFGVQISNFGTFLGGISNSGMMSIGFGSGIAFFSGATVQGVVSNSGTISAGNGIGIGCFCGSVTLASGGITNSGTIAATNDAVFVSHVSTFAGGINNSGRIAGQGGAVFVSTVNVFGSTSAGGGIFNSGTITAPSGFAIAVRSVSTFLGGITNTGSMTAGGAFTGILVSTVTSFQGGIVNGGPLAAGVSGIKVTAVSTFLGGVTNSGAITAGNNGIFLSSLGTFTGAIDNAATIRTQRDGILVSTVNVFGSSSAGGGIVNNGTIAAGLSGSGNGIVVKTVSTMLGGVTNTGLVSAAGAAISLFDVLTFGGGVINTGTLLGGGGGISVSQFGTFQGGISNFGLIASGASTAVTVFNGATFTGGVSNGGTISGGVGIDVGCFCGGITLASGGITNSGAIAATNVAILVDHVSTFAGAINNSGVLSGNSGVVLVSTVNVFGSASPGGGIVNSGTIAAASGVGIAIRNVSTFLGGITNTGTLAAGGLFTGVLVSGVATFQGGITNAGTISAGGVGILLASAATFAGAIVNSGNITGATAAIDVSGASNAITIDQIAGTITGAIRLSANADILNISGGSIAGNIVGQGTSDTINFALGAGNTFTYGPAFGFSGINQVNINSGTVVLDGANSASNVAVNNGGTLAGTGSIDPVAVTVNSGGTLAPGMPGGLGTLSIIGTVAFNPGSFYAVNIAPGAGNNAQTAIAGSANLGGNGTVVVTPHVGHYNATVYRILTTTTGLTGQFAGLTVNGGFTGTMSLDYTSNPGDVDLDVGAGSVLFALPGGANHNQQNVFNGLNNAILNGDTLPPAFANLANLSGPGFLGALSSLSGENATGAEKSAFQSMNDFLALIFDYSLIGRGGGAAGAIPFASEQTADLPPDVALAYASVLKAPPRAPLSLIGGWTAWGSAFGGYSTARGDPAVGSTNVAARDFGFAAGMDYHVDLNTVVGFALAGAGTNWGLAQGMGSGRSDLFQAAVYGRRQFGDGYVAGALAVGNHWFTTDRTALGDQLRATFNGQSYAARLEGGYRFVVPFAGAAPNGGVGITPYAAVQTQLFRTPSYSETDLTGGGFGLSYNAMSATDTRTELGARFDNLQFIGGMPLILRSRIAWAHDFVDNPAITAVFQALPGSAFTVNGASLPRDSALTSASAELKVNASWSFGLKLDGELATGAQTYSGTGTLRYTW